MPPLTGEFFYQPTVILQRPDQYGSYTSFPLEKWFFINGIFLAGAQPAEAFEKINFDDQRVASGLKLMLWGLFQKMVIADTLATLVDPVFNYPSQFQGISLSLATIFYSYQIYYDFSGYSDIAIGCSRLLGFNSTRNFAYPYFSRDIAEFWRRWHMSLTSWFRDYLYIPLGGSRGGTIERHPGLQRGAPCLGGLQGGFALEHRGCRVHTGHTGQHGQGGRLV
jgi:hypothetical protein